MLGRTAKVLVAAIGLTLSAPALAADFDMANESVTTPEAAGDRGWTVSVTPYAWLTGINGTVTAEGRSVSTSASFSDLLNDSDKLVPFMGYVEAQRDRFSIFGDIFYSDISFSGEKTKQLNPVPGLQINLKGHAVLDTTLTIAQGAVAYDVVERDGTTLAVYGGLRYWQTEADLHLKITGSVNVAQLGLQRRGQIAIARTRSMDWVDPLIGMRVRHDLTAHDQLQLAADIGGFGIGSDFSWQLFAGYTHSWDIGQATQLAATLGYRVLAVDYEEGSGKNAQALDLTMHGPLAGLTLRW
jgi:hypothetical protein